MSYIEALLPPVVAVLAGSLFGRRLLLSRDMFKQALPAISLIASLRILFFMLFLYFLAGFFVIAGFGAFFGAYSPPGFPPYLGATAAIAIVGSVRALTTHEGNRELPNGMMIVFGADCLFAVYVGATQWIRELAGLPSYGQLGTYASALSSFQKF